MSNNQLEERRRELERRLAELSAIGRVAFERAWDGGATPTPADTAVRTIPPRDPDAPIPLSYAQEMLWLLERSNPGHAYNVPRVVRLQGPLDVAALQHALDSLAARHEALRTTFTSSADGRLRQQVHPPGSVPIHHFDLTDVAAVERETVARDWIREFVQEPFDLERTTQLRVCLARLGPDDHVLALVSHHIASDGWSGNIVLHDLDLLYAAARRGATAPLPPPVLQYGDYAAWQRRTLVGDRLDSLLSFWRTHLAGSPTTVDLPLDRPRPAMPGFEGGLRVRTVPAAVFAGLRALAREEGVTDFMALLAVYYVLVHRLSREDEIVIATPVVGRAVPELDGVVGFFANTLLLHVSLGGQPSFRGLLHQVRDVTLQTFEHQQVPLEMLISDRGEAKITPPQIMFITEDPGRQGFRLVGTKSVPFGAARGATKFDLTLHAASRADGLRLSLQYRTDLFDASTIDQFLGHYVGLLTAAVQSRDAPVAELAMMDAAEQVRVLLDWNRTDAPYPRDATLHRLVAEQAARSPERVAVVDPTTSLTYYQLEELASVMAGELRLLGVGPGTVVGVCLPRSTAIAVAILGILKAGGCYLPLDPEYPAERLAQIVDDSGVALIITDGTVEGVLPASRARILTLDSDSTSAMLRTTPGWAPAKLQDPVGSASASLAYIIYTSGSTGRPKGVEIEHRSVVNFLYGLRSSLPIGAEHVLVAITPLSFDISVLELFHPLVNGARVIIAPADASYDAQVLAALLEDSGATHLQATPSTWRLLAESGWRGRSGLVALCGGEAMPTTLAAELLDRCAELWNMYGPTEATVWATMQRVTSGLSPIPIGRPMANVRAYVLDEARRPVAPGLIGELYLGGECLARGYRNRPDLTTERFLEDPFAGRAGARMYRTGDRARWREDGTLDCLGRTDSQVKLRGHRIELGEVEHVLALEAGVAQAAAIVREDVLGEQQLVGYIVPVAGASPDQVRLRSSLRLKLPAIMVPAAIMELDALPLTPNGKIDRKALPRPVGNVRGVVNSYVAPAGELEREIAAIWQTSLGIARVGMGDDFFDLGGSSLLAMRMIAEVERVRGQRISFQAFFEKPTVANIAEALLAGAAAANDSGAAVLQRDGPGTPFAFVHGDALGYGWYCRGLAPLLGESPLIVLPTLGPRTARGAITTEAIAGAHIAALRAVQPHGPYHLGGFCHGALVAYEMARQLAAAGEPVERLVMVDPFCSNLQFRRHEKRIAGRTSTLPPEAQVDERAARYYMLQHRAHRWRQMGRLPLPDQLRWASAIVGRKLGILGVKPPQLAPILQDDGLHDDQDLRAAMAEARATLQFVARAQRAFMPGEYPGRVTLIWASDAMAIRPWLNRWGGWDQVARRAEVSYVPGTHVNAISPAGLPALAASICQALYGDDFESTCR